MNHQLKKEILLLVSIGFLFAACTYDTQETIDETRKILPNGKHLVVTKTNKETTSVGLFSNINYGVSRSFTYQLSINPGNINWYGGSAEPKHILFGENTIYIRYIKQKSVSTVYTDSINDTIKNGSHLELHEFFQQHIDERYLFKLLGDDYWVEISAEDYNAAKKKSTQEYIIPNDGELLLN